MFDQNSITKNNKTAFFDNQLTVLATRGN